MTSPGLADLEVLAMDRQANSSRPAQDPGFCHTGVPIPAAGGLAEAAQPASDEHFTAVSEPSHIP